MTEDRLKETLSEAPVPTSSEAEERTVRIAQERARQRVALRGTAAGNPAPTSISLGRRLRSRAPRIVALGAVGALGLVAALAVVRDGSDDPSRPDSFTAFASLAASQDPGGVQTITSKVGLPQPPDTYEVESWFTKDEGFEQAIVTKSDGTVRYTQSRLIDTRSGLACTVDDGKPARCFEPWGGMEVDDPLLPGSLDLPAEPAKLRKALADVYPPFKPLFGVFGISTGFGDDGRSNGPAEEAHLFETASYLLWHPLASPELRSGLFEVLGDIDGIELETDDEDRSGRDAVVVRYGPDPSSSTFELYLDPETSNLLELRTIDPDGSEAGYEMYTRGEADDFPPEVEPLRDALSKELAGR